MSKHAQPDELIRAARVAAGSVSPSWDRPVYYGTLAVECFRIGQLDDSERFLLLGVQAIEHGTHVLIRPDALITVASAACDCLNTSCALDLCKEAHRVLESCADTASSAAGARLAIVYGKLGQKRVSHQIAEEITQKAKGKTGFLSGFLHSQAFCIYVATSDLQKAETLLASDQVDEALGLVQAGLNHLYKPITNAGSIPTALWLEKKGHKSPIVLASLMLWYANCKIRQEALRIWDGLRRHFQEIGFSEDAIWPFSMACLALPKVGGEVDPHLLERMKDFLKSYSPSPAGLKFIAQALVAVNELNLALNLCKMFPDDSAYLLENIVSQLVAEGQADRAVQLFEESDASIRPRLMVRWACGLLQLEGS